MKKNNNKNFTSDNFVGGLKKRAENHLKDEQERQNIAEEIVEIYKNNELSLLEIELVNEKVQRIIRQRLHI